MLSAANISTGITMREESQALNLQASQLSQQTRKFILSFPDTLASAKDMKTAVFLSRKLDSIFPPPQVMLEGLSKTLDDYPTIRINKISWRTSATEETTLSAATSRNSATVIIPAQILLLNGELEEFTGDYRGALEHLERFRQALILRGYSVTALTLPLDVSPQGNLDAETCNGNNLRAQFSLKILWRPVA
jgi:hypothetical protein